MVSRSWWWSGGSILWGSAPPKGPSRPLRPIRKPLLLLLLLLLMLPRCLRRCLALPLLLLLLLLPLLLFTLLLLLLGSRSEGPSRRRPLPLSALLVEWGRGWEWGCGGVVRSYI